SCTCTSCGSYTLFGSCYACFCCCTTTGKGYLIYFVTVLQGTCRSRELCTIKGYSLSVSLACAVGCDKQIFGVYRKFSFSIFNVMIGRSSSCESVRCSIVERALEY